MKKFALLIIIFLSLRAFSQVATGLGYVSNIPDAPVGFNLIVHDTANNSVGFFADVKLGFTGDRKDSEYYENISQQQAEGWGDAEISDYNEGALINAGLTFKISREVLFFSGVGYSEFSNYKVFKDETYILGNNGKYSVDSGTESSGVNFTAGFMIFANDVFFTAGADTNPAGATLGLGLLF